MEHAEIQKMLAAYCGADLGDEDRLQVETHLASCPPCRAELADLETMMQAIRSEPKVEPPPWMAARIMTRVREEALPRKNWLHYFFFPLKVKLPVEAMVVAFVCITSYYLARNVEPEQPSIPSPLATHPEAVSPSAAKQPPNDGPGKTALPVSQPKVSALPSEQSPSPTVPPKYTQGPLSAPPAKEERVESGEAPMGAFANGTLRGMQAESAPKAAKSFKHGAQHDAEVMTLHPAFRSAAPATAARPQLRVRLAVVDSPNARETIRQAVEHAGGTVLETNSLRSELQLTAHIATRQLLDLFERLAHLGRIEERPTLPEQADVVEIVISWQ